MMYAIAESVINGMALITKTPMRVKEKYLNNSDDVMLFGEVTLFGELTLFWRSEFSAL